MAFIGNPPEEFDSFFTFTADGEISNLDLGMLAEGDTQSLVNLVNNCGVAFCPINHQLYGRSMERPYQLSTSTIDSFLPTRTKVIYLLVY